MELNEVIRKKLTAEQKVEFQKDNGKFKLLNNLIIIPIITMIVGFYLESILIVSVSILFIIAFLIYMFYFSNMKNKIYENIIIPYVLKEKFKDVEYVGSDSALKNEFEKSRLAPDYDKIEFSNYFKINEEKYYVEVCKVVTNKLDIEENDGVVDKNLEQNFSGIFARVKLPNKFSSEFKVIKNEKDFGSVSIDKKNTEQVQMNNIEFDLKYDVFSMEPVSLKRILSPGVLARILEMNKKINNTINFSIYDNVLYITVEYDKFLDFKSKGKDYVDEEIAEENLNMLENINYFIRYFVNLTEV